LSGSYAAKPIAAPNAANPADDPNAGRRYVYDPWNRLGEIREIDGDSLIVTYRYDGMARRVRKCVGTEPYEDAWNDFYHNTSWQVLEVRHAELAHPNDQFLWGGNYIDAAVVRWHDSNWDGDYADPCDTVLYYTYDGNYNVTGLVKTDGTVFERYAYDAYGAVAVLEADFSADPDNIPDGGYSGAPYGSNEILYCGYRHDPESGMYCVRFRYYHPALGRWINRDPAGYVDGMDLYEYAHCKPIGLRDPSGLLNCDQNPEDTRDRAMKALEREARGQGIDLFECVNIPDANPKCRGYADRYNSILNQYEDATKGPCEVDRQRDLCKARRPGRIPQPTPMDCDIMAGVCSDVCLEIGKANPWLGVACLAGCIAGHEICDGLANK